VPIDIVVFVSGVAGAGPPPLPLRFVALCGTQIQISI